MIPSVETTIQILDDQEVKVLVPENAVQVFDPISGRFTPLAELFDTDGTVSCAVEDDTFTEGLVMEILQGWSEWYRVPTVSAVKQLFPDTEILGQKRERRTISNVAQERSESFDYARFTVRSFVPGRENPVLMTLDFPAVYRGLHYRTVTGGSRLWRDIMLPDGSIMRSLGALIIRDLLSDKKRLMRRAEYLTDEQIQARWQMRINRIASSLYLSRTRHEENCSKKLSDYESAAVRDTVRMAPLDDSIETRADITPARARLDHSALLITKLATTGEISSPLHTPAGAPCSAFYRPWSERRDDGQPIQLWKHPLSGMVNPARSGILAADIHCLPLARGSKHRVKVDGFPYYESVHTRELLGMACDLPCVLGDGVVISESAAHELTVILETWKTLSPDELINHRAPRRSSTSTDSRLRGSRPKPILLPSPGGSERKWQVFVERIERPVRVGDKLQSGIIKGVVNRILSDADMPKVVMPDGTLQPADIIFSWRHWQKWGVLSEVCRAQLAYWCAEDDHPLVLNHSELSTLKQVKSLIEQSGGNRDLTLPVLFNTGETLNTYAGYFPVGVREQLSDVQSQESHVDPMDMRSGELEALLLTPDRISTRGVRLGYADINCLCDDYPEMTKWLLGFSSDAKLKELAKVLSINTDPE